MSKQKDAVKARARRSFRKSEAGQVPNYRSSGRALNCSCRSSSGQGMTEYILIVVLIAVAALATIKVFGGKIKGLFSKSADSIESQTKDSFGK